MYATIRELTALKGYGVSGTGAAGPKSLASCQQPVAAAFPPVGAIACSQETPGVTEVALIGLQLGSRV